MLTFLFWNVNGKSPEASIAEMASAHNADLLVLVECASNTATLLDTLNRDAMFVFHYAPTLSKGIMVFCRFSPEFLSPRFESPRIGIHVLGLPARPELILVIVHFPSKLFWSDEGQAFECTRLSSEIRRVETAVGHSRTVLLGDLNMNPFEKGLVRAIGLNATMTRRIALRRSRTVQAEEYPFFYNPMWNLFGDEGKMACGTFYYDSAEHVNYYWNMFDQVLVRPDLLTCLPVDSVKVVTDTPSGTLLTQDGRPNAATGSDHLPLVFRLDM